ncbi:type I secretion C-terminal target domain-containing protein, partial [Aestuariicella sp. G3-2]|uniref:type I secretion C-terminal target domain-containing protein n=1 Tax=Pseudomaricurvus albidus TaxID=2842452 RepID=UPI001C0BAACF
TYTVANADVQYLGEGDTKEETFTVLSADGTAHDIVVTITGTNDAPTITNSSIQTDEDIIRLFSASDFPFSDVDGDSLQSITITAIPSSGELQVFDGTDWNTIASNTVVTADQLIAGEFRYVPELNVPEATDSGANAASFTYTLSDGVLDSTEATMQINIIPVADTPILQIGTTAVGDQAGQDNSYQPPVGNGLFLSVYNNLPRDDFHDASAIETELTSYYTPSSVTTVSALGSGNTSSEAVSVDLYDALTLKGLIYLEAGHSYVFSGYQDDTFHIELGGTTLESIDYNNWDDYTSDGFVPTESGYYTLEVYAYNGAGEGYASVLLSDSGGAPQSLSEYSTYTDLNALESAGGQHSAYVDNAGDGGYYPARLAEGLEGSAIHLPNIDASLTDTDGSELLSVAISAIPVGAILSDGMNSFTATAESSSVDVTDWDLNNLTIVAYIDSPAESFDLNVSVTATERENGSTAQSAGSITVSVIEAEVSRAPSSSDQTIEIQEDEAYTLTLSDFAFNDQDGDNLVSVIVDVPSTSLDSGELYLNGVKLTSQTTVSAEDIAAGLLVYQPATDVSDTPDSYFTYSLVDDGSTANGGVVQSSDYTMSFDIQPVADTIPGSAVVVSIGEPVVSILDLTGTDGGTLQGKGEYGFPNGVTLSTFGNGIFTYNSGAGLGVDSATDSNFRIETAEEIGISFPTGMQAVSMRLKNVGDDTPRIGAILELSDLAEDTTVSGQVISVNGTTVLDSNLQVQLQFTMAGGATQTLTANLTGGGSWIVDYSSISLANVTEAKVITYVDGNLFSNGGDTISLTYDSDISSVIFGNSGTGNGYQISYVSFDVDAQGSPTYTYPIDLYAPIQDVVGVEEAVSELMLGGFPDDITVLSLTVVDENGAYTEISPDEQGNYDLTSFSDLLETDTSSLVDKIYLTTDEPLADDFSPNFEVTVVDGSSYSKTIVGGTEGSTFLGTDGDDVIYGGLGSDTMTGEGGQDTFSWQVQDAGAIDTITDFQAGVGGDVLNFADLLQGEDDSPATLDNYLDFSFDSNTGNTTITVDVDGAGAGTDTQSVILEGVEYSGADQQIIQQLLNDGNLIVD